MYLVRVALIFSLVVTTSACSWFGGGSGSGDDVSSLGEENIPLALPGGELKDVNFAYDSSALDSVSRETLRSNADWLLDNPDSNVVIEGHCDERGTAEYNLALGERRAQAVSDYLRSLGVQTQKLDTVSYGEELPLDPASNEAAWAKNRRAHFSVK